MPRANVILASLIALPLSFLICLAEVSQNPETVPHCPPNSNIGLDSASLIQELDRAIVVLKQGLKENWKTRDQYLAAFEHTPTTDSAGRSVTDAKEYVEAAIGAHLRTHQIWDEGPPIGVEVQRTIAEFVDRRKGEIAGSSSSCAVPSRRVVVSAGVAADMLKTKIDPVYPAEALKNHVFGTVVLRATITAHGHVGAVRVISGPGFLQQAALDAVRQWTYRPYLLNNIPAEVETTINIVFAPSH